MKQLNVDENPNRYDFWDVSKAAGVLSNQACTLAARHIEDGTLRTLFNRDIAYYARSIVRDVEQGRKTPEQGMEEIQNEQRSLLKQSADIIQKGLGVVAGGMQIMAGGGICYTSAGVLCATVGVPLIAHGANNIYENGRNLWESRSDTQGPVREAYQSAAKAMGGSKFEGNMAYGAVDLGTSVYGLARKTLKPGAWRLFRYVHTDYVRGYVEANKAALSVEAISGGITVKTMYFEAKENGQ